MKKQFTKIIVLLPGLILVAIIGIVAKYCSSLLMIGSVAIAIILGIMTGNLFSINSSFQKGILFAEKKLLGLAIMLLGVQLNVVVLHTLGLKTIVFIILMVSSSVIVGYFTGKLCKLPSSCALLLGIGNGICGSSAIAGAAPLIRAKEEETGIAIAIVNFLGTFGIFLIPAIAKFLFELTTVKNGIMIGGTLQAVGQVTAAGFGISDEVGNIATIVKMGRILLLGPILFLLSLVFRSTSQQANVKSKLPVPTFIIGFVILAMLTNLQILPVFWIPLLKRLSKELLILAMASVGLKITFSRVIQQGPKALLVGSFVFLFQIAFGLSFLLIFY